MSRAYLTIDDAPSERLPEKLAVLQRRDIPALFFCEGRRLADYSDQARQAVEAGFHLGDHTYSHEHASDLTVEQFTDEVERTESLLEEVYNAAGESRPAELFRFPYGDRGGDHAAQFQQLLTTAGFAPPDPQRIEYDWYADEHVDNRDWFWTVSVEDWEVETEAGLREQIDSVADRLDHPSDDIVLFHDAGNSPDLFESFLELLAQRDVEFGDPMALLDA